MKALIVSCEAGGGCTDISVAVKEKLEDHGHEVTLFDLYRDKGETTGSIFRKKAKRGAGSQSDLMRQYLEENPYDVIIAADVLSAILLSVLRSSLISLPKVIYVASDYTCAPFTEDTWCDHYVIPSQKLTAEFCRRGIPKEKVIPLGMPVRKMFLTGIGKADAGAEIGLAEDRYNILMSAVGLSGRKLFRTVRMLQTYLDRNRRARLIVFGVNQKVGRRLQTRIENDGRITLMQELSTPAMYMRACDVMIAGAQGSVSTEAAVLGTALIQYMPSSAYERHNAEFFSRYGMSLVVKRPGTGLLRALKVLEDEAVRRDMIKAQRFHISQLATAEICNLAETPALSVETGSAGVLI
ncbi:MAG: hypothetical protein IJZ85_06525 [Lachnospiraceae bacterium]|nr:hypothetical protein [Lachnospiraceae bacterium]